jgi:hypothetical protein
MTKRRWLDRWRLGEALRLARQVRVPRRRRLYLCAWCRRIWDLLTDPRSRRAVEVAELFADGQASDGELAAAHSDACLAAEDVRAKVVHRPGFVNELPHKRYLAARSAARASASQITAGGSLVTPLVFLSHISSDDRKLAGLVRDVFGDRPVTVEPTWLTWNHGTVPAIARHVYDDRAYHDLPILADALEDAGCTNADLLEHCRGPGPHVRGCWAVDLLLGKG